MMHVWPRIIEHKKIKRSSEEYWTNGFSTERLYAIEHNSDFGTQSFFSDSKNICTWHNSHFRSIVFRLVCHVGGVGFTIALLELIRVT